MNHILHIHDKVLEILWIGRWELWTNIERLCQLCTLQKWYNNVTLVANVYIYEYLLFICISSLSQCGSVTAVRKVPFTWTR